jgi:hypothetical protein
VRRFRHGIVTGRFGIVTARFGGTPKSVTMRRNQRSRYAEIVGHDHPKWAVTLGRNTHRSFSSHS